MKTKSPAIDLTDFFNLLAVWELNDEHCWELLTIERPKQAIALCREQPSRRLVFPTGISPEGVWGSVCKKRSFTTTKEKPARKPLNNQEMVLALITASPCQSSISLALKLGITVAAVRQLLRKLAHSRRNLPSLSSIEQSDTTLLSWCHAAPQQLKGDCQYPRFQCRQYRGAAAPRLFCGPFDTTADMQMSKPIGYYASAPSGTQDKAILCEIESNYGSWLEKLTPSQKSSWAITLLTEAIKPEGVEVNCNQESISNFEQLFSLSDGNKLALCLALINQLVYGRDN